MTAGEGEDGRGSTLELDVEVLTEAPPPPEFDVEALERLVPFLLRAEGQTGRWVVAVVFTDDARLRALHRDFMGMDHETDVMTFPLGEPESGAEGERGGDVVVSVERAAAQAPSFGLTAAEETRFLVVHGLLHLCGWDDADPDDRARMLARQGALIAAFERGEDEAG